MPNGSGSRILGIEGHDLKTPCVSCQSSDAGRVHVDTGVFYCYACQKALNAFDLCKVQLGDHKAAIDAMVSVGLFDPPKSNGNGQAPAAAGNGKPAALDIIGDLASKKGVSRAAFLAYGARDEGGMICRFPMYDGSGKVCSTFG